MKQNYERYGKWPGHFILSPCISFLRTVARYHFLIYLALSSPRLMFHRRGKKPCCRLHFCFDAKLGHAFRDFSLRHSWRITLTIDFKTHGTSTLHLLPLPHFQHYFALYQMIFSWFFYLFSWCLRICNLRFDALLLETHLRASRRFEDFRQPIYKCIILYYLAQLLRFSPAAIIIRLLSPFTAAHIRGRFCITCHYIIISSFCAWCDLLFHRFYAIFLSRFSMICRHWFIM